MLSYEFENNLLKIVYHLEYSHFLQPWVKLNYSNFYHSFSQWSILLWRAALLYEGGMIKRALDRAGYPGFHPDACHVRVIFNGIKLYCPQTLAFSSVEWGLHNLYVPARSVVLWQYCTFPSHSFSSTFIVSILWDKSFANFVY